MSVNELTLPDEPDEPDGPDRPDRLDGEERRAAWVLQTLTGPPLREKLRALAEERTFSGALRRLGRAASASERARAETGHDRLLRAGYCLVVLGESGYPRFLARIHDPPIALAVRGTLVREDDLAISVVGSRRATPYGRETAHKLARELAARGLTIVSGLARGIDAEAHRGALDATGRTIAVLGSGLDNLYPREHRRLADRIVERGCALVSEFGLDEPPHARNFPQRNRIVTGLTLGTLVVEAAVKSGSLVSARLAMEQDREVFAVPGPVGSPTSEGVHELIRDGARLVTRAEDVIEELRAEVRDALRPEPSSRGGKAPGPAAAVPDPDERAVLASLGSTHEALDLDAILDAPEGGGLTTDRAIAALVRLEMTGRVASLPGGLYRAKRD
jgi:DNA processing protein